MSYLGNALSEYNYSRTPLEFTATQGQTTFAALYRTGFAEFYRNGVRLSASDVQAINGTSFTLTSPCAAGDVVAVLPNTEFKAGQTGTTANQFDSSASLATTEFVRRQGMQYAGLPTVGPGTTLDASHVGKLVILYDVAGAGGTVTLPDAAVLPNGAVIDFINGTGSATYFIAPKVGATINGIAGSVAIVSPSLLRFMVYGGAWIQYGDKVQTPPQFDNDNSIATTAFVQRAAGNFQDVYPITTTPVSLSAADVGKVLNCYGSASSVTLPNGAGINRGSAFVVYTSKEVIFNAYSGNAIVAYPGAGGTVTSVTIPANTTAVLFWTGGAWNVAVHGAGTSNQSTNGYQKLPSGLLIQWGTFLASASADVAVTFPVAFPNAVLSLAMTQAGQNAMYYGGYNTTTLIGFNGSAWSNSTTRGSTNVSYIAIGR